MFEGTIFKVIEKKSFSKEQLFSFEMLKPFTFDVVSLSGNNHRVEFHLIETLDQNFSLILALDRKCHFSQDQKNFKVFHLILGFRLG